MAGEPRNTQYEIIWRPYSIIGEFGMHISVGNKYGVHGIKRIYEFMRATKLDILDLYFLIMALGHLIENELENNSHP